MGIKENIDKILKEIPANVNVLAAAKSRTSEEIDEAVKAGIKIIGENYLQEALQVMHKVKTKPEWHFIGHLQRNKVKKAVTIFDMIETVDSIELAREINKQSIKINKVMPVLIEINSGSEPQKAGVIPENAIDLIKEISKNLCNIKIMGLMTMGPLLNPPEKIRPFFKITRELFENIKSKNFYNVEMKILSMGMSASYKIAIEEGANLIRLGTIIFGPR